MSNVDFDPKDPRNQDPHAGSWGGREPLVAPRVGLFARVKKALFGPSHPTPAEREAACLHDELNHVGASLLRACRDVAFWKLASEAAEREADNLRAANARLVEANKADAETWGRKFNDLTRANEALERALLDARAPQVAAGTPATFTPLHEEDLDGDAIAEYFESFEDTRGSKP